MTTTPDGASRSCHCAFSRSVDVDSRLAGKLLLVVRATPVELAVAQHDAAFAEHRTLELCDRQRVRPIRELPGHRLRQDLRRTALPCRVDQVLVALGTDSCVQVRVVPDLRCVIRQVGELVQDDVGLEVPAPPESMRRDRRHRRQLVRRRVARSTPPCSVSASCRPPHGRPRRGGESAADRSHLMRRQEILS